MYQKLQGVLCTQYKCWLVSGGVKNTERCTFNYVPHEHIKMKYTMGTKGPLIKTLVHQDRKVFNPITHHMQCTIQTAFASKHILFFSNPCRNSGLG